MATLSTTSMAAVRCALVGCLVCIACVSHAALNLNILNACDDLAALYESLRANSSMPRNCRSPSNAVERALVARTQLDTSQLCFVQSAPGRFLEGFSCIRSQVLTGAVLTCFRPAALSDIRTYKEQFGTRFAEPVSRYLSDAAACRASNRDATQAPATMLPPLLSLVSRFEFGYITSLGKGRPSDSSVVHGYAATDRTISGDAPSALEFVSVIVGAPKYSRAGERKTVGDWVVYVDDDREFDKALNEQVRRKRVPVVFDTTSYELERYTTNSVPQSAKLAGLERLQRAIARSLEDEGFEAVSDDDLKAHSGMSSREFVEQFMKNRPFGWKQNALAKFAPTLLILLNEKRPRCTKDGGAMAAFLMATEPIPEVDADFGGIALILVGMGECSRSSVTSTRTYINGLIEEATNQLLTTLQR